MYSTFEIKDLRRNFRVVLPVFLLDPKARKASNTSMNSYDMHPCEARVENIESFDVFVRDDEGQYIVTDGSPETQRFYQVTYLTRRGKTFEVMYEEGDTVRGIPPRPRHAKH